MFSLKNALSRKTVTVKHSQEFFHLAIIGRSGSGKTRLLLKLLSTEFSKKFNTIILICPTFSKNASYDGFGEKDDKVFIIGEPVEQLDNSIRLARTEASKYFRSLLIFDDCIATKTLSTNRTSEYVHLLIGGRHDGISTITLSQQLTSISKPARDQLTRIISFYNPDADDRKVMFGKYLCDVEKEEIKEIISFLRERDYSYIDINILKGMYKMGD